MTRRTILGAAAGAVTLAAAGAGVDLARRHRAIVRRAPAEHPDFGSLRGDPITVVADDGTPLHVEVDEVDGASGASGASGSGEPAVTVVFCHGYALTLDCWHFQRAHLRGRVRTVFYDQRSHGRSGRSPMGHATIDQLGEDLRHVLEAVVPEGPVVLVGHSMGGMTIVALADQHPELFGDRVRGVALISTTAGGLDPSRVLLPIVPGSLGSRTVSRGVATLARGHRTVDRLRKAGRRVALVTTDQLAFGDRVPAAYVRFVDDMLAATPFEVVAEFFPGIGQLDKFHAVAVLSRVPTTIICGTADRLTGIGHSRKLHSRIEGSTLVEESGAGHMVILERAEEVDAALDRLLDQLGSAAAGGAA